MGTAAAQLLHIAAMYTPGLREVLHLEGVSARQWLASLGLAVTLFVISELHKALIRRRLRQTAATGIQVQP